MKARAAQGPLILLLCCAGLAQNLRIRPAPPSSLGGSIVDGLTGKPLPGANVTIRPAGPGPDLPFRKPLSTISDDLGEFGFPRLDPGGYTLSVEREGYLNGYFGATPSAPTGISFRLASGEKRRDVDFQLTPEAQILGRVIGANGAGAADFLVWAGRAAYRNGKRRVIRVSDLSMPNRLGYFGISKLPAGRYYLVAEPIPPGERTYYPGTSDPGAATALDATAGATIAGKEIRVGRGPEFPVSGRLVDRTQPPLRNLTATLVWRDGTTLNNPTVNGRVNFGNLPAGRIPVIVWGLSAGVYAGSRREIEVKGPTDDLELTVDPAFPVRGHVAVEGGFLPTRTRVRLELEDPIPWLVRQAEIGAGGAFTLAGVGAERYFISVQGLPRGYYLKSARLGAVDVLEDGVAFNGDPGVPLEIVVSAKGAVIRGSVAQAGPGVTVAAVPQAPKRRLRDQFYGVASTDDSGRFAIAGVPPGDYRLFAWQTVEHGAWTFAEFMRPIEPQGKLVTVAEGGSEQTELTIFR